MARTGVNQDYDAAERGSAAYTAQSLRQGGNPYSQAQSDHILRSQARALDEGRSNAMRNLQFQEANAGLGQFNTLMNLMQGGSAAALNLGGSYASAQNQAIGMLSQQSQGGAALTGAVSGAATGATLGPYGALAGALVGGAAGYFGAG